MAQSYRDLVAWQKAMDLVTEIYRTTENFPPKEMYGLTSQLRRAAVSVPSNVAEGQALFSRREFRHFLRRVRGLLAEIETQFSIARNLGYITDAVRDALFEQTGELGRILNGLIASIPDEN